MDEVSTQRPEKSVRYVFMTVIMLTIALVLPFAFQVDIGPGPDSIRAMIWDYIESSWHTGFRLWDPLDTLPYTLLRLIFAIMLARVYANKTTPQRTLIVGIFAELQPVLVSAPLVFLIDWPGDGDPLVPLYIPFPIMLAIGVIFILYLITKQMK